MVKFSLLKNERRKRRREMGKFLIKVALVKGKVREGGRKRMYGLVKAVKQRKMGKRGREVVYWMIEMIAKREMGKRGRKIVHRVIEFPLTVENKSGKRKGERVN